MLVTSHGASCNSWWWNQICFVSLVRAQHTKLWQSCRICCKGLLHTGQVNYNTVQWVIVPISTWKLTWRPTTLYWPSLFTMLDHSYQLLSTIVNHNWPSFPCISHSQSSLTINSDHQPLLTIIHHHMDGVPCALLVGRLTKAHRFEIQMLGLTAQCEGVVGIFQALE